MKTMKIRKKTKIQKHPQKKKIILKTLRQITVQKKLLQKIAEVQKI